MTLDEAREVLSTTFLSASHGPNSLTEVMRVLDITPETHLGMFHALRSLVVPGAYTANLDDRHIEALRVYLDQWAGLANMPPVMPARPAEVLCVD